jgi:hypothetical protein
MVFRNPGKRQVIPVENKRLISIFAAYEDLHSSLLAFFEIDLIEEREGRRFAYKFNSPQL